jgi:hypothetical protein
MQKCKNKAQAPVKDGMSQSFYKKYRMLDCSNSKLEQITSNKGTQTLENHLPGQQDMHFPGNRYYPSQSDL